GCHLNPGAQQGQDLSDGMAWSNIVGVPSMEDPNLPRVAPGNPDGSYLILKLQGSAGIVGERMPFGGPYLSQAEIDVIRKWILDGARDVGGRGRRRRRRRRGADAGERRAVHLAAGGAALLVVSPQRDRRRDAQRIRQHLRADPPAGKTDT